jgi:YbgC/YbaW family acyl-CoA thioester hydrolase
MSERGVGMVFTVDMPVRWVDTDALRVVHYSNYFRYVEAAEEELYRSLGFTFKELNEKYKIAVPRVEAFCRYEAPARYGDVVTVRLQLSEKAEKILRYDFEIHRKSDGELLCSGYLKIIGLDLGTWKATALPADLIAKVASALK